MKETFQIGDVVRLNSGGPDVTVRNVGDDEHEMVRCTWHDEDGTVHEMCLPALCLRKVHDYVMLTQGAG